MEAVKENSTYDEFPIGIKWKIAKTKLLCLRKNELQTSYFEIPSYRGISYRLAIRCNDYDNDKFEFWIYLDNGYARDLQVKYTIYIGNCSNAHTNIYNFPKWEYRFCCHTYRYLLYQDGLFVDGYLTIKLRGSIKNIAPEKSISYPGIENTLWNDDEKDFEIVVVTEDEAGVANKSLYVHKLILRLCSPVFATMFNSGMKESIENKVEMKGFSFEVIEAVMKFCYGFDIRSALSLPVAMAALQFADIYDIEKLKDQIEKFLFLEMNEENVLQIKECSIIGNSQKLEQKCRKFLRNSGKNGLAVKENDSTFASSNYCQDFVTK